MYLPSNCLSNLLEEVSNFFIRLSNKEPVRWIFGTNFRPWKLHLHRSLCIKDDKILPAKFNLANILSSKRKLTHLKIEWNWVKSEAITEAEEVHHAIAT